MVGVYRESASRMRQTAPLLQLYAPSWTVCRLGSESAVNELHTPTDHDVSPGHVLHLERNWAQTGKPLVGGISSDRIQRSYGSKLALTALAENLPVHWLGRWDRDQWPIMMQEQQPSPAILGKIADAREKFSATFGWQPMVSPTPQTAADGLREPSRQPSGAVWQTRHIAD